MQSPQDLHITYLITGLVRGGAEQNLVNLLTSLRKQFPSNKATVLYFHDGPLVAAITELGIPCIKITATLSYSNPLFFIRLMRTLKTLQPQVIQTDLWAATLLGSLCGKLLKIPVVSVMHNNLAHTSTLRQYVDWLTPWKPTCTVAVSHSVALSLQGTRFARRPLNVIANGVDARALEQATHRTGPQADFLQTLKATKRLVGAVGRLVPVKNYPLFLESFKLVHAHYPATHAVIIGSGPEEKTLQQLAHTLGIAEQVTFLGAVDARPYYQFFDCYLQPSFSEGLSIALLEALSNGVPALASSTDGTHDILSCTPLTQKQCILPPHTPQRWAARIIEILENPALHAQLSATSKQLVHEKFSLDTAAAAYQKLYQELTRNG